jgi:hypothetical protein
MSTLPAAGQPREVKNGKPMLVINRRDSEVRKAAAVIQKRRPGDRISLSVPVRIFGLDNAGHEFSEEARTIHISRNGAVVVSKARMIPHQRVIVWCKATGKQSPARVVGVTGGKSDGIMYALALTDIDLNPWGVVFPPAADAEQEAIQLLLQCTICLNPELSLMNELEHEVFETRGELVRHCNSCSTETAWHLLSKETKGRGAAGSYGPTVRSGNERKEVRAQMKLAACIRLSGFGEEAVVTDNVSRQGLCFWSHQRYLVGSRIEVAVPYAPTGVNIFSNGRIVYVEKGRDSYPARYRVSYTERKS